ncbi:MAG: hypothetical protein QM692_20480 [Thermomicrobiales bacterium]
MNGLEPQMLETSDEEFRQARLVFNARYQNGESLDDLLPEVFASVREVARRGIGQRHFDVQLMGGMVLHQGKIAEMRTGEGKTLTATTAVALNAITGEGAHLITVNDYLVRRDTQWMGRIYSRLGLSVGCIQHDEAFVFDADWESPIRVSSSCARSSAAKPMPPTSPTARTTSSGSTTCATIWCQPPTAWCSAIWSTPSSTRSITS